jgi:hypothetical protein
MFISEQALFQRFFEAFAACRSLQPRELRAARCIAGCGTRAMGAHVLSCPQGACEQLQFHACRHRSCPRCAQSARSRWIEAEFQRLLPCPHWHIVLTLPHELIPLWSFNRARFTSLFMRCARESLLELMRQPRYRGAPAGLIPGLLLSLHTWGRTLSYHPHVHCLVSAGGIDASGLWRDLPHGWVLPVRVLQALLRGKLLGALAQALRSARWVWPQDTTPSAWQPLLRKLWRKHWNVEIRGPYPHGRGVVLYLARYAKGAPVPPHAFLELLEHPSGPHELRMPYLDHRSGQQRTLHLSTHEFISRVLWHAPARGIHTTRHAGLYTAAHRNHHHAAQQQLAHSPHHRPWPRPSALPSALHAPQPAPALCPHCQQPMLRGRALPPPLTPRSPTTHHPGDIHPHQRFNGTLRPTRGPTGRSSRRATAEPGPAMQPNHHPASPGRAQPLPAP